MTGPRSYSAGARGMALAVLAGIVFALMNVCLRQSTEGLDTFVVAWWRFVFGLLFLAPWFLRFGWDALRTARLPTHLVRSVFHAGAYTLWYLALPLIPLAELTALGFTQPLFITLGAALVLGERLKLRRILALAIGFAGILIILRPGFAEIAVGALFLLAAQPLAATQHLIAKSLSRTDSPLVILMWQHVLATVWFLPAALYFWQVPSWGELALLAIAGVLGTSAYFIMLSAYRLVEISALQPLSFLTIIWASVLGYWFFAQVPDVWIFIGGALIVLSTSYVAHREQALAKEAARQAAKLAS